MSDSPLRGEKARSHWFARLRARSRRRRYRAGRLEALGDGAGHLAHDDAWKDALEGDGAFVGYAGDADGGVPVKCSQADAGDRLGVLPEESRHSGLVDPRPLLELGDSEARAQARHVHAVGLELLVDGLREAEDEGLGGRVHGVEGAGLERPDGPDVENAAPPPLDHPACGVVAEPDQGTDVQLDLAALSIDVELG